MSSFIDEHLAFVDKEMRAIGHDVVTTNYTKEVIRLSLKLYKQRVKAMIQGRQQSAGEILAGQIGAGYEVAIKDILEDLDSL